MAQKQHARPSINPTKLMAACWREWSLVTRTRLSWGFRIRVRELKISEISRGNCSIPARSYGNKDIRQKPSRTVRNHALSWLQHGCASFCLGARVLYYHFYYYYYHSYCYYYYNYYYCYFCYYNMGSVCESDNPTTAGSDVVRTHMACGMTCR